MPKHKRSKLFQGANDSDEVVGTLNQELAGCRFEDVRVGRRFKKLVRQLARNIGQPIPLACQDWANTKAAYRFLSNEHVDESAILAGHFQATRERVIAAGGPILVLHDTTEFTFSRESVEAIGILKTSFTGWAKDGRLRQHTLCGILMHSSLAVTVEGLPLGLTAIRFWTRSKFKGTNALKRTVFDVKHFFRRDCGYRQRPTLLLFVGRPDGTRLAVDRSALVSKGYELPLNEGRITLL